MIAGPPTEPRKPCPGVTPETRSHRSTRWRRQPARSRRDEEAHLPSPQKNMPPDGIQGGGRTGRWAVPHGEAAAAAGWVDGLPLDGAPDVHHHRRCRRRRPRRLPTPGGRRRRRGRRVSRPLRPPLRCHTVAIIFHTVAIITRGRVWRNPMHQRMPVSGRGGRGRRR